MVNTNIIHPVSSNLPVDGLIYHSYIHFPYHFPLIVSTRMRKDPVSVVPRWRPFPVALPGELKCLASVAESCSGVVY